jgi:hypothetical protein
MEEQGPCAVAIREAGIKQVVIATLYPNPVVSGNGVRILKDAGIEVIIGIRQEESQRMNEVFNQFFVEKKPFVTVGCQAIVHTDHMEVMNGATATIVELTIR